MSRSLSVQKGMEGVEEDVDLQTSSNKILIIDDDLFHAIHYR